MLRKEICVLCSDKFGSIMKSKSESVREYSCNKIIKEMESGAPTLLQILRVCTQYRGRTRECLRKSNVTRLPQLKKRQNSTIAMCVSILRKYRCPHMSLLQKVISIILYAGSSSKIVSLLSMECSIDYVHWYNLLIIMTGLQRTPKAFYLCIPSDNS